MSDGRGPAGSGGIAGSAQAAARVLAFPRHAPMQVGFTRQELQRILDLYGRMVSSGQWRDYAMEFTRDVAVFAAFRRSSERPQTRIEKRPALRARQGMWALYGEQGQILRRGHELAGILAPLERKLVKLIEG